MKLAIISSNQLRHNFFINSLIDNFDVVGIAQEVKKRDPSKKGKETDMEPIVKKYFDDRAISEKYYFGKNKNLKSGNYDLIQASAGGINEQKNVEKIKKWKADYLAVFGSSILKEDIIGLFKSRHIINLHLGLSPYYRGSGTNFWPQYEEKLEYVGATIHYLDKGIDTGRIIHQCRPEIELGDTPHSIGNKTIRKGANDFVEILKKIEKGKKVKAEVQDLSIGKLYLFKDCTAQHIRALAEKFKKDLLSDYLKHSKESKKVRLVVSF